MEKIEATSAYSHESKFLRLPGYAHRSWARARSVANNSSFPLTFSVSACRVRYGSFLRNISHIASRKRSSRARNLSAEQIGDTVTNDQPFRRLLSSPYRLKSTKRDATVHDRVSKRH